MKKTIFVLLLLLTSIAFISCTQMNKPKDPSTQGSTNEATISSLSDSTQTDKTLAENPDHSGANGAKSISIIYNSESISLFFSAMTKSVNISDVETRAATATKMQKFCRAVESSKCLNDLTELSKHLSKITKDTVVSIPWEEFKKLMARFGYPGLLLNHYNNKLPEKGIVIDYRDFTALKILSDSIIGIYNNKDYYDHFLQYKVLYNSLSVINPLPEQAPSWWSVFFNDKLYEDIKAVNFDNFRDRQKMMPELNALIVNVARNTSPATTLSIKDVILPDVFTVPKADKALNAFSNVVTSLCNLYEFEHSETFLTRKYAGIADAIFIQQIYNNTNNNIHPFENLLPDMKMADNISNDTSSARAVEIPEKFISSEKLTSPLEKALFAGASLPFKDVFKINGSSFGTGYELLCLLKNALPDKELKVQFSLKKLMELLKIRPYESYPVNFSDVEVVLELSELYTKGLDLYNLNLELNSLIVQNISDLMKIPSDELTFKQICDFFEENFLNMITVQADKLSLKFGLVPGIYAIFYFTMK